MNFNTQNNNLHNIIKQLRENGSQIYSTINTINSNLNKFNQFNSTNNSNKTSNKTTNNSNKTTNKTTNNSNNTSNNTTNNKSNLNKKKFKKINGKPELIKVIVNCSLKDIYKYTKKKIYYKVNNKEKEYTIPLIGKELLINGIGNDNPKYKLKGDVKIIINSEKMDNYIQINNYDLKIIHNISIYDFYHNKTIEINIR